MTLNEIVIQRVIKSIYMGFILDRICNEYLGKTFKLTKDDVLKFAYNFNCNTDLNFNKINIEYEENDYGSGVRIRALKNTIYLTEEKVQDFHQHVEELINKNLKKSIKSNNYIEVFDLNTLDLLDRYTYNTMGDKYVASNSKRYMVNFIHLYSIADYY